MAGLEPALHDYSKFGLAKPSGIRFSQEAQRIVNSNEWGVNVYLAWDSIQKRFGGKVEDFELHVSVKRGDGSSVSWLIPSELLEGLIFFTISEEDFRWSKFMID